MIGEIIGGRYQIDTLLSSDYAGRLYLATELSHERQVTIRFLDFASAAEGQRLFVQLQKQFDSLASLAHPGIVPVITLGRHDDLPYLVAIYSEGVSLSREVEMAPLAMERVIHITLTIGQLLSYLHDQGIVHGDLRPQNVILEPTRGLPFVKLAGFGAALARDLSGGDAADLVYLAPERIQGQEPDVQADLYSLGVILHVLSTGQLPSWQPDGHSIAILPRQLNMWIPNSLEELILELLARDPGSRPATAGTVVSRLEHIGQNDLFPPGQPISSDEPELPGPPSWEL